MIDVVFRCIIVANCAELYLLLVIVVVSRACYPRACSYCRSCYYFIVLAVVLIASLLVLLSANLVVLIAFLVAAFLMCFFLFLRLISRSK